MDETYEIRPLGPDDAEQLGPLHVRIWQQTYRGLMTDEALASLDVEARVAMWRRWLGKNDSPGAMGAFERSTGTLVGWITVGDARDADAPVDRELWVLNVEAAHQGSGLARTLMTAALGGAPAYLWVVEGNERAIAFYRRHGFEFDGGRRAEDEGNDDLRMVRSEPCESIAL